jgi:hypothetical protein
VKVLFGIVCDEVRREDNGKLLLIGVYGDSIIVPALPASLVLSLALWVEGGRASEIPVEFRVMLDEIELRKGKGHIKLASARPNWIAVPPFPIEPISKEGTLYFQVSVGGEGWDTVASLPLTARKPASPG